MKPFRLWASGLLAIIISIASLTGCGTFNTLSQDDQKIASRLRAVDTKCTELPRVYSGAMHNLCALNSKNEREYVSWRLVFYTFDTVPSMLLDTVVLPFTFYTQSKHGDINLVDPLDP